MGQTAQVLALHVLLGSIAPAQTLPVYHVLQERILQAKHPPAQHAQEGNTLEVRHLLAVQHAAMDGTPEVARRSVQRVQLESILELKATG